MFRNVIVVLTFVAYAAAKPGLLHAPLALAPAPIVTAASSQVVARTFNGIATAPIIAPVVKTLAPIAAPLAAAVAHPLSNSLLAPVASALAAPLAHPLVARYAPHFPAALAHTPLAAPIYSGVAATPLIARYAAAAPLTYSAPALW